MPHSYTCLKCHIIFGTKYRLSTITPELEPDLYAYIGAIIREKESRMIEIGGTENHIHILVGLHQSRSVSSLVCAVKASSSSFGKERSANPAFAWQSGYAAFAVSESQVPKVREYIRRQKEHHRKTTYEQEVREICRRHGIVIDESFFEDDPQTHC